MKIGLSNPFNYTGGKYRYLNELQRILPMSNNLTVLDPFFGGGDLSTHLNVSWEITAGDTLEKLIEIHREIKKGGISTSSVMEESYRNELGRFNDGSYDKYREYYNKHPSAIGLYVLLCHSNSNRIRFSRIGYNVPFGKRWFNAKMQEKLIDYRSRVLCRDISFKNMGYSEHSFDRFDLILIDPPYLNTLATYNDSWSEHDERMLHAKINSECRLNKFVYFGQTWSKGVENKLLIEFSKNYNVQVLKDTTSNCSANRNNLKTQEIMIYN